MIAFVLKNNEGLYYTTHLYYEDIHTEDISEASIYNRKIANDIKLFLNQSTYGEKWEVVEITITEGNFDAYINNLQDERDFERRDKTYIVKQLNAPNDYVIREDYIKLEQENKQLKEQLGKKDKEIKILKKALELACERITELLPFHFTTKEKRINYFIQQAKGNKDVEN